MLDFYRDPFAVYGTFITLNYCVKETWDYSVAPRETGLYLQNEASPVRGGNVGRFAILRDGKELDYRGEFRPGLLRLSADGAYVEVTYDNDRTMRFRGKGCEFEFQMTYKFLDMPGLLTYGENRCYMNSNNERTQLMFTALTGRLSVSPLSPELREGVRSIRISSNSEWELAMESFTGVWQERDYPRSFEECAQFWEAHYQEFCKGFGGVAEKYQEALRDAAYILWSATVKKNGLMKRDAIYMSRRRMRNLWSWDHCYNAMSLADVHPDLAWDQLCIPFDFQDEFGRMPDSMNMNDVNWTFTKPPIQGSTLTEMLKHGKISDEQLEWLYPRLALATEYWFKYSDWDGDGLCQYENGNSSGWDNCTYFTIDGPFESAELAGFLVLQMEALAAVADRLGKTREAGLWRQRAAAHVDALVEHFWDGTQMRVLQSGTHIQAENCDSLLPFLVLFLGHRLPKAVFDKLVEELTTPGRFITPYGIATEGMGSPWFGDDSYWRGSIWPTPMHMLITGLYDGGEKELAIKLAQDFCDNVVKEGFAENFSPIDGRALCDTAYTWTASVFILVAQFLYEQGDR